VPFQVTRELTGAGPWLTPSLSRYISIEWDAPAKLLPEETYTLTLKLNGNQVPHTLGGTLHLRQFSENEELRRTYPVPLPISVRRNDESGEEDEGGEQEAEEPAGEATISAVTGAADFGAGGAAPGQIISIWGKGLGPKKLASLTVGPNGKVSDYLADTQVLVDGVAAPVLAATENQINAVIPFTLAGKPQVDIVVTHKGRVSNSFRVLLKEASPALFTINGKGFGPAAALNQNGTLNTADNTAARGSVVVFYATGLGVYKQPLTGAEVVAATLPQTANAVSVTIGGVPAQVQYAGGAPGMVSAVVQLNVLISPQTPVGDAVPLRIQVGNATSPPNVTIAVK
jgi:uncharacterized protein (TIGR03437 family)